MKIDYSDLEDQVIDGFYVDSLMKCCWAAQLNVLEYIENICKKYNIQYFADFGTMLGAVRHGGMIPWDDDIDISMKRPDYDKFLKVARAELPEEYHVLNYRKYDEYWSTFARVINANHISIKDEFLEKNYYFPFSTGIDIFPLDYVTRDKNQAELLRKMLRDIKGIADCYGNGKLSGEELQDALDYVEELSRVKIPREGDIRTRLYDILLSLFATFREDESEEMAMMPVWAFEDEEIYSKKYFTDVIQVPYWKGSIPLPIGYDGVLSERYGMYMNKVRNSQDHEYPYYKKQIDKKPLFQFQYKDRTILEERDQEKEDSFHMEELTVLENAHISLYKLLLIKDTETAMKLLLKCQECAISMGNKAEAVLTDCEDMISFIEEYCEIIFQIYEMLQQNEVLNGEAVFSLLTEQLQNIKNLYNKGYEKKKKVVFLVDKADRWDSLKEIWKAAKEDKNTIVSVIAIPYVHKTINGKVLDQCFEIELFPEELEVIDCRKVDLEQYQPDVIFINNPYDEYNYITSVPLEYYSTNLMKYTKKLIYIPWFTLPEFTREDELAWQSMQHYVTVPGVVHADKVFVQSEQMKNAYVEYLTEWAGEDTKEIWEEKISSIETILGYEIKEEAFIPEAWNEILIKKDGNRKNTILYTIHADSFAEYGMMAVTKLKTVLENSKKVADNMAFIWNGDKETETILQTSYPELWKEYQEIVEQYKKDGWGIYVEDGNVQMLTDLCNAFYGDECSLSQAMKDVKKSVVIQKFDY